MTAIKKSTSKPSKSPAPATKTTTSAKPAAKKKVAVASTPVIAFTASSAPKVKPVATKPVVTAITAKIDVGFGNALYVRGEGPGLSWNKGVPMTCVGDDVWSLTLGESARGYTLKFLINDSTWSVGPDFNVS